VPGCPAAACAGPAPVVARSPDRAASRAGAPAPDDLLALLDAELCAVPPDGLAAAECGTPDCGPPCHGPLGGFARRVWQDHRNYYGARNFWEMGYALAGASVLANTSLDADFQGWYRRDVRTSSSDDFARFCKVFGEGEIFAPSFACLALATSLLPEGPLVSTTGEFADRTTRAYLVGAPPMLFMQGFLGGSRPGEDPGESRWKAFDDNNAVGGHAFMGAVPFITAAQMSDRPLVKTALYACSTLTAWSRINDDAHYLSQVCLGWWMAYMACRAVDETQAARHARGYEIAPLATPEMAGVGVTVWR